MDESTVVVIRETATHRAGVDESEPEQFVTSVKMEFLGEDDELLGSARISDIHGLYYDPEIDDETEINNAMTLDALSGDLEALNSALVAWFREHDDDFVRNIIHIEDLTLKPAYRGRGLGSTILEHLLEHWSRQRETATMVTFWAVPLHESMDVEEWRQVDPAGYQEEQFRFVRFYERHGFRLAPNSDFLAYHLAYRPDRMSDLRTRL